MSLSKVVERAVELLCKHYKLPVEEAKSVVMKKKSKKMMEKPLILVPFLGKVDGWCDGLKLNHGLYSQCTNKPMATGELCKTCQKQADTNEHGKPNCGLASEREADMENWRDPKNRTPVHFGNLAVKMELDINKVVSECKRIYALYGDEELPSELFEVKKQGRGRPKKVNPIVSDTDDEDEHAIKARRGRPKKASKKVVDVTNDDDDLISTLVAQAKQSSEQHSVVFDEEECSNGSESEGETKVEKKPVKKTTKKGKLSEEEKEAAKKAKEAEKAKKAEEKEAAKKAKEAEKAKKAEEKKVAKAKKAEEKKAAKETKKAEEEKPNLSEEELKADAEELSPDEAVSESEDEIRVERKTIDNVEYMIDDNGVVYDINTQEAIGMYVEDEDRMFKL